MLHRITDIHHAIIDYASYNHTTTTTQSPIEERLAKNNKIDALTEQIKPIVTVSEKIQEVWNVVVGTKNSVDHLLPKSDQLLTQTQRQERAIGEIHNDLKTKTNKIIANLDKVDRRLKKQENDVANLAQGPVRAELLLDPTIDRLIEFDPKRWVFRIDDRRALKAFDSRFRKIRAHLRIFVYQSAHFFLSLLNGRNYVLSL